jgi:RNA polymerase sigma-70 factor, ECF subfamily
MTSVAANPPITELLVDWKTGDESALERLAPLVYDDLRRLAGSRLRRERPGQTLQPTALVHETYLQLSGARSVAWEDRSHFFGIASRLMQQILIQRARGRTAAKRGGGRRTDFAEALAMSEQRATQVNDIAEALGELAEEDQRKASIVDLRYFGGLTTEEIAAQLGVSASTVEREMRIALAWLYRYLKTHEGCGPGCSPSRATGSQPAGAAG